MFRKEILAILTVVILFRAGLAQAVEDRYIYSDAIIEEGDEYANVYIYDTPPHHTTVNMTGGKASNIYTYDASMLNVTGGTTEISAHNRSTVNVTGGTIYTLDAREFSTANISGGYVHGASARDSATVNLSDNGSLLSLSARGSFGTVNMTGGSAEYARAGDSGTLNLYGGVVTNSLNAWDSAAINIFGYDLFKTATGGTYGYGFVTGFWCEGTPFNINFNTSETHSYVNLIPVLYVGVDIKPESLNLAGKGNWITCHIYLPQDYNVNDIDSKSIVLARDSNEIKPEWLWFNEDKQVVMAKFNRADVCEILEAGDIGLTIRGHLADGTCFEGADTIRVIERGHTND